MILALTPMAMVLASCVAWSDDWSPPNLASNPGFEDVAEGNAPASWGSYTTVTDVVHSGDRSLFYENADPTRYVLAGQPLPLEVGRAYEVSVWIRTEDVQGEDSGATICLEWYDADDKYLGGHYPAGFKGTGDWRRLTSRGGRVPEGATRCSVICYLRQGMTGKAWWDDVEVKQWRQPPLDTLLLRPNYRGEVRPGTRHAEILAELDLRDYEFRLGDVALRTEIVTPDGVAAVTRSQVPKTERTLLRVPVGALSPGPYEIRVSACDRRDGTEFDSGSWPLRVLESADAASRLGHIDEHNRLIRDDKPFFPLGMYWGSISEEDIKLYADSAMNCLMPYGAPTEEQMDLAHEHGLRVIYSVKDIYHGSGYAPEGIETIEDERAFIEDKAARFRDHPALLAWYPNDELSVEYMDRLEAHQRWMEELDPNHPTWVVLYQVGQVGEYVRTFDVIGTDPYPIPGESSRRAARWTQMTVDAVQDHRPVWQVPQVFNWANYRKTEEEKQGLRPPTYSEMRSMAWQCITHGAKGLIFYSWFDIKRDTVVPFEKQWNHVKLMAAEVSEMIPVILSVEPTPELDIRERDWLHWTTRRLGDTVYFIAVSDDDVPHHATVRLPDVPERVRLRGQGEIDAPEDGKLRLEFEPHGLLVYEMEF